MGRSLWLDPLRALVIQVQPGDRCEVTVLDALLSLSPGRFPCAFGPHQVPYTHFGSASPGRARLRLHLRYDAPTYTPALPFTPAADLTFPQPELVTRNRPWLVEKLRGWSQAIDGSVLDFAAPVNRWGTSGTRRCRLTLPPPQGGPLPRYGRLVDATGAPVPRGEGRDCEASVRAGVRYQHTAATPSPSWDYVPLMAALLGPEDTGAGSVEVRPREHLQLLVSIRDGVENTAPRPSFGALMTMRSISSC